MTRAKYTYTLSPKDSEELNVKTITLVELTADEEVMAAKRARNEPVRLAWELAKEALRGIDDKVLSTADGTADTAWEKLHPKVRSLLMQGYNELHNTTPESVTSFLTSRQTEIA